VVLVSVLEGLDVGFSQTGTDTETNFSRFERNNANKVGFRNEKYIQPLKTLVSVSNFPTTYIVISVSVSEK
jgi:hypothetical protein